MDDPWNPTPNEIREWAYTEGALEPCQDWDLALSWCGHERAFLEIAADDDCPGRLYILNVLYLMVGDAVRTGYRGTPRPVVEGFVERGTQYAHPDIQLWQERSRNLMANPDSFDYDLWCAGGMAARRDS